MTTSGFMRSESRFGRRLPVDAAIALAEAEVAEYCSDFDDATPLALIQAYQLLAEPRHGAEAYSLMRDSELSAGEYLTRYFDTGAERQR